MSCGSYSMAQALTESDIGQSEEEQQSSLHGGDHHFVNTFIPLPDS